MSMVSNKLGDPLLDVSLESFVGEEGYLEREVELGHGGVAKVKHETKSCSCFGPPGLLHVVGQTI